MRKLSYGKPPQGERELAPDKKKFEDVVPLKEASEGLQELHPPAGYDPIATETQSPDLFIVISGGEKRERLYLEQLKRRGFRSLSIEFVAPQGKSRDVVETKVRVRAQLPRIWRLTGKAIIEQIRRNSLSKTIAINWQP